MPPRPERDRPPNGNDGEEDPGPPAADQPFVTGM